MLYITTDTSKCCLNSQMILQLKCISATQMQTKFLSPHVFLTAFMSPKPNHPAYISCEKYKEPYF